MILIRVVVALTVALTAAAAPGFAQDADEPAPMWRVDLSRLEDDLARLEGCFELAGQFDDGAGEERCVGVVVERCRDEIGEDAATTTGGARRCNWRGIAAWEEALDDVLVALRAELAGEQRDALEAAQAAWDAYMLANVRARAAHLTGPLGGVVAGGVRARMTAERAVELRAFRRETERR